jgi:hypothetical protein
VLEPRLLRADKTEMGTLRDKPGLRRFLRRFTLTDCRTRGVGTPGRMLGETPNRRVVRGSRTG